MSEFYKSQKELIKMIDEHQKESKEWLKSQSKVTVFGYKLNELLDIIDFAINHGYKRDKENLICQ